MFFISSLIVIRGFGGFGVWGNSFVADPAGQVLAEAGNDKEELLVAEIDPKKSEEQRRNWPFFPGSEN